MSVPTDAETLHRVREHLLSLAHDLRWHNQGGFAQQVTAIALTIPEEPR